ncbi:MAG: hypothetical protein JNJ73_07960 [Hyphomonadaceae bacterium]|nr:hypothetical protein [Hyphomonadaceae bacterium]
MGRRYAMFLAGAVMLTAGVAVPATASAQETVQERAAARAEVPWYERFTYSQGAAPTVAADPSDRRGVQAWAPSRRWGVTVNLNENGQAGTAAPTMRDETAVGAYYQFTPNVRVGGAVSVGAQSAAGLAPVERAREADSAAGVRLESAFRF